MCNLRSLLHNPRGGSLIFAFALLTFTLGLLSSNSPGRSAQIAVVGEWETDENGEFELVSDNFNENTTYIIVVEHRNYKKAEVTGIKPVKNSTINLGWIEVIEKEKYEVDFEKIKLKPTSGDTDRNQPVRDD